MKYVIKFFILIFLLMPVIASAEVKEIICEGTYNMGDGETPSVAESRALLNAKRTAIEQAGTYVESYSKVKNLQLTEDEIKTMASGVMEVSTLDKKRTIVGDGIHFWVKIKALVNSDKMEDMATKVKDKSVVEDYKKIQVAYDKSQKDIEELKKQLQQANGDKKKDIEVKIASDEKRFQANEWYEKGLTFSASSVWGSGEWDKALEAFTVTIAMDPQNGDAYAKRGHIHVRDGNYEKAISDFEKAASLCSGDCQTNDTYGLIYECMNLGGKYFETGDYYKAIAIFSLSLPVYDRYFDDAFRAMNNIYLWRGISYGRTGQFDLAIRDYNTALAKIQDFYWGNEDKARLYAARGFAYFKSGDNGNALADFRKACDLGNADACNNVRLISN